MKDNCHQNLSLISFKLGIYKQMYFFIFFNKVFNFKLYICIIENIDTFLNFSGLPNFVKASFILVGQNL